MRRIFAFLAASLLVFAALGAEASAATIKDWTREEALEFARKRDFSKFFPEGYTYTFRTEYSFQGENVRVAVDKYVEEELVYYVADIYVRTLSHLKAGFSGGEYRGSSEKVERMAEDHGAVIAINGDYYRARAEGIVVRNSEVYRKRMYRDVCVIYQDGVMETYLEDEFDIDEALERGVYQAWSFGPALLDEDGMPKTKFNSDVTSKNPRSAIGYYSPGHYCFVAVDGRTKESRGMTMTELSELFYELGCVSAYNMDGGQTSVMAFGTQTVNSPSGGGRRSSDIIYVCETLTQQ